MNFSLCLSGVEVESVGVVAKSAAVAKGDRNSFFFHASLPPPAVRMCESVCVCLNSRPQFLVLLMPYNQYRTVSSLELELHSNPDGSKNLSFTTAKKTLCNWWRITLQQLIKRENYTFLRIMLMVVSKWLSFRIFFQNLY